MREFTLTPEQSRLVQFPLNTCHCVFVHGPAGCGKTTSAVQRMLHLLRCDTRGDSILVWVPQRSYGEPFVSALHQAPLPPGSRPDIIGLDGLARRSVELFWPLVAHEAGFASHAMPVFLNLETAQYYLNLVVEPLTRAGRFGDVVIARERLLSQILDNLNKAALVGFPLEEIGGRLGAAWRGSSSRLRVYEAVQEAAGAFRLFCLRHNLLDYSLQLEVLLRFVWPNPDCRDYWLSRYRHLIADNAEEDVPIAHDLLAEWLDSTTSALVVSDDDAGFRTYLGADPAGVRRLADHCDDDVLLEHSMVCSPTIRHLEQVLIPTQVMHPDHRGEALAVPIELRASVEAIHEHFHTDLVARVVEEASRLAQSSRTDAQEIAIVAPFMDDALRFALATELEAAGTEVRVHRPSRALDAEPAARCLITLACLAHPSWGICPPTFDVAQCFRSAIADLDWLRASLLAQIVYRTTSGRTQLSSFELIQEPARSRISYVHGERYEKLRGWLIDYQGEAPVALDLFLARLFDEVIGRPGFGFHGNLDAAGAAFRLIESVHKFRRAAVLEDTEGLGRRYIRMVQERVVSAHYVRDWTAEAQRGIFLGPAYTFLAQNRAVAYQFWLGANSPDWGRRLYQPLTHPFVLSRHWPQGRVWTEEDEAQTGQGMLARVVVGLLRRCRERVYVCSSTVGARGYEERGALQTWVNRLSRRRRSEKVEHSV